MEKIKIRLVFLISAIIMLTCGCNSNYTVQQPQNSQADSVNPQVQQQDTPAQSQLLGLSSGCDYILCTGTDMNGNIYELVANQTESALGYEITVGVIKNNEWIYPMSADFPFLGEDGLFHVDAPMGGESGSDLSSFGKISSVIHFVDIGAFVMESVSTRNATWTDLYEQRMIFFNCNSLDSFKIDSEEYILLYRYSEDDGKICTDNGKILVYTEVSGTSSGWLEDQVFDWALLDIQTPNIHSFGNGITGIRPESCLSEGLFFASDQCFYNTNAEKVIDLSAYNIDTFYDGNLYFENGICTFKAKNDLGSIFLITIDTSGNVLSEVKQ